MISSNPLVEKQYNEWVYPEPIDDIDTWKTKGHFQYCDPSEHFPLLWPERAFRDGLSILVAGCGTSQAAILAHSNPGAEIVGIDLSEASLACTSALKEKHNLKNLELRQMDLQEVGRIGRQFDLIYATGVLHHLPDPQKGLQSLIPVLADSGVMCLMLYGKYLRQGVYMLQEALQRMGVGQTPADVALVRRVISALPKAHAVQSYLAAAATDLVYDGGIVDTFLHPQDRAYSVPEVLDFIDRNELMFQGWVDPLPYCPEAVIPYDHPAYPRIMALPNREQWAVVELLMQSLGTHGFLARKKNEANAHSMIDFYKPSLLDTKPSLHPGAKITHEEGKKALTRSWSTVHLDPLQYKILTLIDGNKTVGDILAAQPSDEETAKALQFLQHMGRMGHLLYSWV